MRLLSSIPASAGATERCYENAPAGCSARSRVQLSGDPQGSALRSGAPYPG
jgi:hypothetical protein